ncbi:GAF domain-containing protein [Euzebya tangerina]|uniref:GAF domain-containing protein n=1 Tax=Euzebya tangerina TaxID=591198 RepID=UPI000E31AB87|nr:GAF and ANTAR domain-containing protein [Euzebya tangerina]
MSTATTDERMKRVLVHFAQTLVSDFHAEEALDKLMAAAPTMLDVDGAGVMLEDDKGELRFVAASNDRLRLIEEFQVQTGQGPCVMAYETGQVVLTDDLEGTTPFPAFAEVALSSGMRAVHSFPMKIEDLRVGALNLYRDKPGPLPDDGHEVGQILADIATSYLFNARKHDRLTRQIEGLRIALDESGVIDQAKGVLMHTYGLSEREAFGALRRYARRGRNRVLDVARTVMEGKLDLSDVIDAA